MIKYTLIIWVCSFLEQSMCMAPVKSPILYNSWYECSRAAHKESLQLLSNIGYKAINDSKIAMKYACIEVSSI